MPFRDWKVKEVLLEFNGPELVVLEHSSRLYLSVAVDEDESKVRWLRTPVSETELKALHCGATTVRECICKPGLVVVDAGHDGAVQNEYDVLLELLAEECLPSEDSFLPEDVIAESRTAAASPVVSLDGPAVVDHAISFVALSDVLKGLQRLWTAIGQRLEGRPTVKGKIAADTLRRTELLVNAFAPGSVRLELSPRDPKFFAEIADEYRALVFAPSANDAFQSRIASLRSRVRAAYAEFIRTLQKHNVEVFARWNDTGAFLGPSTAARIEPRLASVQSTEEDWVSISGHFDAFHLSSLTFVFIDDESNERYEGQVSKEATRENPEVMVGGRYTYSVELFILTVHLADAKSKHIVLQAMEPRSPAVPH